MECRGALLRGGGKVVEGVAVVLDSGGKIESAGTRRTLLLLAGLGLCCHSFALSLVMVRVTRRVGSGAFQASS